MTNIETLLQTYLEPEYEADLLPNLTKKVIKALTPPIQKDVVRSRNVLVFGKKEVGKTTTQRIITKRVREEYGPENVNALMSQSYLDLSDAIGTDGKGKIVKKPVQILNLDDPFMKHLMSGGRTKDQSTAVGDFQKVRHTFEDRIGYTGVIIEIMGPQRYHGFETHFRDAPVIIFKTTLSYDERKTVKELLLNNEYAYSFLEWLENQIFIENKDYLKSYSVVRLGSNQVGYTYFPLEPVDCIQWVNAQLRTPQIMIKKHDKIIERHGLEILKMPDFDPLKQHHGAFIREYIKYQEYDDRQILTKKYKELIAFLKATYMIRKEEGGGKFESEKVEVLHNQESFTEFAYRCCEVDMGTESAQILKYTMQGKTQEEIADVLWGDPDQQHAVSKLLKKISESYLGYWYEKYFCGIRGVETTAGNAPVADYDHNGEIISLKCRRTKKYVVIDPTKDCVPEIRAAIESNKPFKIALCNILWGPEGVNKRFEQITKILNPREVPKFIKFFMDRNIIYESKV